MLVVLKLGQPPLVGQTATAWRLEVPRGKTLSGSKLNERDQCRGGKKGDFLSSKGT